MAGGWSSDRDVVARVKAAVDIVDVVGQYLTLRQVGRDFLGLCPFHEERTPSFHVSREKQLFYCFGCHAGGDVVRFVELKEGLSFREALEELARRAGLELPPAVPGDARRAARQEAVYAALEAAAAFFVDKLWSPEGEEARAYLKARGLEEETLRRFRVGFAPRSWDALVAALGSRGHGPEVLGRAGLVRRTARGRAYSLLRGRVTFPVCDERGRVVAFGGRALPGGEGPKYLNSPESEVFRKRAVWYGLHLAREAIRRAGRAVVVEGYLDCVAAHQAGFPETVASLGTALAEEQARLLARFTGEAFVAYDADAAGQAATLRGFARLREAGLNVRLVSLPEGRDPDECLRADGPEAFRQALQSALPLVEYLFQTATRELDLASVEGKAEAVRRIAPALLGERDPVRRDYYVQRYAHVLGVSDDAVRTAVNDAARQAPGEAATGHKPSDYRHNRSDFPPGRGNTLAQRRIAPEERKLDMAEEVVLTHLVHGGAEERRAVWSRATPDWFRPGPARELAEALAAAEGAPGGGPPAGLGPEAQALFARLSLEEAQGPLDRRALEDCLAVMAAHRVRRRYRERLREVRALEAARRPVPREWLVELNELLREMRTIGASQGVTR